MDTARIPDPELHLLGPRQSRLRGFSSFSVALVILILLGIGVPQIGHCADGTSHMVPRPDDFAAISDMGKQTTLAITTVLSTPNNNTFAITTTDFKNLIHSQLVLGDRGGALNSATAFRKITPAPQSVTDKADHYDFLNVIGELLAVGAPDQAKAYAMEAAGARRGEGLTSVAVAMIKAGHISDANKLLSLIDQAFAVLDASSSCRNANPAFCPSATRFQTRSYIDIGSALAMSGDFERAQQYLARTSDLPSQLEILKAIAQARYSRSDNQAAQHTLDEMHTLAFGPSQMNKGAIAEGEIFRAIADAQIACNQADAARQLTLSLYGEKGASEILESLAEELVKLGRLDDAEALAKSAVGEYGGMAVLDVAEGRFTAGDLAGARRMLAQFSPEADKIIISPDITNQTIRQNILSPYVGRMVQLWASLGDWDDAIRVTKTAYGGNHLDWLVLILKAEANRHDAVALDSTLTLALSNAQQPNETPLFLIDAVPDLLTAGYPSEVKRIVQYSAEYVGSRPDITKGGVAVSLAAAQARLGDDAQAMKTVELTKDVSFKDPATRLAAVGAIVIGGEAGAAVVGALKGSERLAYQEVARAQADAGRPDDAAKTEMTYLHETPDQAAFMIVQELAKQDPRRAYKFALSMKDAVSRGKVMEGILGTWAGALLSAAVEGKN